MAQGRKESTPAVSPIRFRRVKEVLLLLGAVGTALFLRLLGLGWGLPSPQRVHSYHPDEITVLAPTLGMNIFAGEMNPHFFNYGSLFLYTVYFARLFAEGYGWLDLTPLFKALAAGGWLKVAETEPALLEFAKLHLLARGLSLACGVATVALVFFWVRRWGNLWEAAIAAFLLACFPLHVQHSQFATVDVPLTLLTTLALFLAATATSRRRMLWAAFVAGLATAVKYSVAPALWLTLAFLWTWRTGWQVVLRRLVALTLVMGAGFLLGCPYALLSFPEFWRDFYWETFVHSRIGHGYVFVGTGNGHWFHLTTNLPAAVGIPAMLIAIAGLFSPLSNPTGENGESTFVRQRTLGATLIFALAYFLPLGFAQVRFARYLMPLLPLLAIWAALVWGKQRWQFLWRAGALATVGYTFLCGLAIAWLFLPPDPRDEAAALIAERGQREKPLTIALHDLPWFYTPPFCPLNGGMKTKRDFEIWQITAPMKLVLVQFDVRELAVSGAHLFVASDFEYGDPLRLGLDDAVGFYEWLATRSREERVFQKEPRLPWRNEPFRWSFRPLPHDMRYVNPTIKVFVLR